MKKFTDLLGFVLLIVLLGFIALISYQVGFDIPSTLENLLAFGYSALSPVIDVSNINLVNSLQWVGILLFTIASILVIFDSIKKLNLLRMMVSPLSLVFTLTMILIFINGYYPDAVALNNLGLETNFLDLVLLPLTEATPSLTSSAFSGLLVGSLILTLFFHIFVLLDTVRNPHRYKQAVMMPILKEETIIAQELSKFVIPNQIKMSPSVEVPPQESPKPQNPTETHSLLNPTPIVFLPPAPSLPEKSDVLQARQKVLALKEKIRAIIRHNLMEAKLSLLAATPPTTPVETPSPAPVEETSTPAQPTDEPIGADVKTQEDTSKIIQQQVSQAIATEIAQLEPRSKEQVATIINEELIKYDSLNREVIESLVSEKIENQIGNAIDQYKQEMVSMVEKTLEDVKTKVSPLVPGSTPTPISQEQLQTRIQQTLEQNPIYQKLIAIDAQPKQVDTATSGLETNPRAGLTTEEVLSLIQTQTLSPGQIQELIQTQSQQLNTPSPSIPKEFLSQLITVEQLNQALQQLTAANQTLIQQQQHDLLALKDMVVNLQTDMQGRFQPLQEKIQQFETKIPTSLAVNPVDESYLLGLMQKHQATLKPQESMAVIASMVSTAVKKEVSEEPRIKAADVERMIQEAVARLPQPQVVEQPKVLSEAEVSKLVEAKLPKPGMSEAEVSRLVEEKLPKQVGPVLTEAVIASMVSTAVKKEVSEEPRIKAADVERMIQEAVARLPQPQVIPKTNDNENGSSFGSRMVTPTLTIPVIRKKNAKAPDNEKRAEQFKSVITPESGITRTGKKKIIRIPFQQRMSVADPLLLSHYDEIKNYILSFQVKSRISNAGDIFRLHKEEYVKIAIAGKGLKLYMALNPEDYKDGPIPVDDASDKKMYKDIPLVFKVKSELSVKRAKKLIDDLMAKKGLPQKEIPFLPWSKAFQK